MKKNIKKERGQYVDFLVVDVKSPNEAERERSDLLFYLYPAITFI